MSPPNVVLIMLDQLNYRSLGYQGHPVVRTPNIDRLRKESVEFTHCYVQSGFCLPSRTSYLSGQYLFTHRQYGFTGLVSEGTPSMGLYFRDRGYRTSFVGKAHVNSYGEGFGFDEFVPTLPEDIYQSTDMDRNYLAYCRSHGLSYPNDQVHGDSAIPGHAAGVSSVPAEHSQERYTANEALRIIDLHRDGRSTGAVDAPFFLTVSFDRPHPPLTPSPEYASLYSPKTIPLQEPWTEDQAARKPGYIRKFAESPRDALQSIGPESMRTRLSMYFALITHIDEEIGRILDHLAKTGLYDRTVVAFCADHGDLAGHNGLINKFSNRCYYDHIVRTPLFIKYPNQEHAGTRIDNLVEAIDLFPTLAEITGGADGPSGVDGRSLHGLLRDPSGDGRPNIAFSESYSIKMIRKDRFKLIYTVVTGEREFYDLESDPDERENIYDDAGYVDVIRDLKMELIKKLTPSPSPERRRHIESLFDSSDIEGIGGMGKLAKWRDRIIDGGGFWMVCTDEHQLTVRPFDGIVTLSRPFLLNPDNPDSRIATDCDDPATTDALLDDLIDYICATIRPVSLMMELGG